MFGAKKRLRAYLNVIRGWAMGKQFNGWVREDFETKAEDGSGWVSIPEVKAAQMDATRTIFPVIPYDLSVDRLFLSAEVVQNIFDLNQKIASFNTMRDRLDAATDLDLRWALIILLHGGTIGTKGGAGIHASFLRLEESL